MNKKLIIGLGIFIISTLIFLSGCGKIPETLLKNDEVINNSNQQQTATNNANTSTGNNVVLTPINGVTGRILYNNNTAMASANGRIIFYGNGLTLSSAVSTNGQGIFNISSKPAGIYEIVIKISDGSMSYIGSITNVNVGSTSANVGDIIIKPIGYASYKLEFDYPISSYTLNYDIPNLTSGLFRSLTAHNKEDDDSTDDKPKISGWFALPEGKYTMLLLPEGTYDNSKRSFEPITLNITITAGTTTNIGTLIANKKISYPNFAKITGKVLYPDNTLVTLKTATYVCIKNQQQTEATLNIDQSGAINLYVIPDKGYEIGIKIVNNGITYLGSVTKINANSAIINLGEIKLKAVGSLKYKMVFGSEIDKYYLSYSKLNLSNSIKYFLSSNSELANDTTTNYPKGDCTTLLPEGDYAIQVLPTASYQNTAIKFDSVDLNFSIIGSAATDIGNVTANPVSAIDFNGKIRGEIRLSDNTLVSSKTGQIAYKVGAATLLQNITLSDTGLFLLNDWTPGDDNIGIKIIIDGITYIGAATNVTTVAGKTTNVGSIVIKPLGTVAYELYYDSPLTTASLSYTNFQFNNILLSFLDKHLEVAADSTNAQPKLKGWIALPEGNQKFNINPSGSLNYNQVNFKPILIDTVVGKNTTNNIGIIHAIEQ